jgi:AraC family transcriptional regulator
MHGTVVQQRCCQDGGAEELCVMRSVRSGILPRGILPLGGPKGRSNASGVVVTQARDWPGVVLEAGRDDVTAVDGQVLSHHYLSLNADDIPYAYEVKEARGFRKIVVPPQGLWVCPANESITTRPGRARSYVRLSIDPVQFDRLLGQFPGAADPIGLRRGYAIDAPGIALLLRALVAEADAGAPAGLAFVEAVTAAISRELVRLVGVRGTPREPLSGRLSPAAKRRVLEVIDAKLDARLTVEALAREVGMSVAHFAHAFKNTTGRAPHQFLLSMRLDRARRLLETPGISLSTIARHAGFADQSHLARLFKREYGVTPSALLRQRQR